MRLSFQPTAPPQTYSLSLHDALPICQQATGGVDHLGVIVDEPGRVLAPGPGDHPVGDQDSIGFGIIGAVQHDARIQDGAGFGGHVPQGLVNTWEKAHRSISWATRPRRTAAIAARALLPRRWSPVSCWSRSTTCRQWRTKSPGGRSVPSRAAAKWTPRAQRWTIAATPASGGGVGSSPCRDSAA